MYSIALSSSIHHRCNDKYSQRAMRGLRMYVGTLTTAETRAFCKARIYNDTTAAVRVRNYFLDPVATAERRILRIQPDPAGNVAVRKKILLFRDRPDSELPVSAIAGGYDWNGSRYQASDHESNTKGRCHRNVAEASRPVLPVVARE